MVEAFTFGWLALLVVGLLLEAFAIVDRKRRGDTLSEHVWWLRAQRWGRPALYASWFWLTWHFIVDEFVPGATSTPLDDLGVALAGGLVAFVVSRRRGAG